MGLLARYGNVMKSLVADTFPEIFPKTEGCFSNNLKRNLYYSCHIEEIKRLNNLEVRREFLFAVAKKGNFDPLQISNWRRKEHHIRARGVSIYESVFELQYLVLPIFGNLGSIAFGQA